MQQGADADDFIANDGSQDRLTSAAVGLALVFPSLKHRRDDPNALLVRMAGERRDSIRQKSGGRHDPEQLAHGGGR